MVLLELVTQGVRGFAPNARTAFDPGYTEVASDLPEGAPSLSKVLLAALYGEPAEKSDLAADPVRRAKLALTLQGTDGGTYRVVRELGGTCVVQKLNPSSQRFEPIAEEAEVDRELTRLGVPPRRVFERLCLLTPDHLPSRKAQGARGSERLRALVRELDAAREVEALQAKQDELVAELYPVEAQLRALDGVRAALEEAERAWSNAPSPEDLGMPPDIAERLTRYPEAIQKRAAALEKLAADRESVEAMRAQTAPPEPPVPLYRDPRFLIGAGLGTAFLAGAAFLEGTARYLALLDVPAYGAAALVAIHYVDGVRASSRGNRTGDRLAMREKRIEEEFEGESRPVKAALAALSVDTPEEALNHLGQKAMLGERYEDLKRQLAKAESDPSTAAAMRQHAMLKARADVVSAKLEQRAAGYVRHSREVETELHAVQVAEAKAGSRQPVRLEDPGPDLVRDAAGWAGIAAGELARDVAERCARYVSALTAKRYLSVEFGPTGSTLLVGEAGRVRATELPPQDADLLYLALRLTIAEKWVCEARAPMVVLGVEGMVSSDRQPLLARMLKHLGASTQVLS